MSGFVPSPPARNNRSAMPFVRPSGEFTESELRIYHMPPGGHVFINGSEVSPVGGVWRDGQWVLRNPPTGTVARITAPNGEVREASFPEGVPESLDWEQLLTVTEATSAPALRVAHMPPNGTATIDGVNVSAAGGSWSGSTWTFLYPPNGSVLRITAPNGLVRQASFSGGVPADVDWDAMQAAPAAAPVLGVGLGMAPAPAPRAPASNPFLTAPDDRLGGGAPSPMLTITGVPSVATNLIVRVDGRILGGVLSGGVWSAPSPGASDAATVEARVQTGSGLTAPVGPALSRVVAIPAAGVSIPFASLAPSATSAPPARPVTGVVIVGMPHYGAVLVNGTPAAGTWQDAAMTRWLVPIAPAASVTVRVRTADGGVVRESALGIPDGAAREVLYDALPLVPAPTAPPAPASRDTQGPTSASATTGTILLRGVPPQSQVRVGGVPDYTVNDSGKPVAVDVAPGVYGVTVNPPGSVQRTAAGVTVAAGMVTTVDYGSMRTPSALTDQGLQPVNQMCGAVTNRLSWQPASACPGEEVTGPDGTRYRALAVQGGVAFMALKADAAPAAPGLSATSKVLLVGALVAAAGGAWWYWQKKDAPQDNPGKKGCHCGGPCCA